MKLGEEKNKMSKPGRQNRNEPLEPIRNCPEKVVLQRKYLKHSFNQIPVENDKYTAFLPLFCCGHNNGGHILSMRLCALACKSDKHAVCPFFPVMHCEGCEIRL